MGKDNKKKKSSFGGHDNAYDYLRGKFNEGYKPFNANRQSEGVYNRKRDQDFERYLFTGDKRSGFGKGFDRSHPIGKDRNKEHAESLEGKLFEAGIPVSQWGYYASKAGIGNANSAGDADSIISAYDADERFQGNDKPESTKAPEAPKPEPIKVEQQPAPSVGPDIPQAPESSASMYDVGAEFSAPTDGTLNTSKYDFNDPTGYRQEAKARAQAVLSNSGNLDAPPGTDVYGNATVNKIKDEHNAQLYYQAR